MENIKRDSVIRNRIATFLCIALMVQIWVLLITPQNTSALQTIPYKMNYQGRLMDSTGAPKADGTYNMKFRILDASTGGTEVWSEERAVSSGTGITLVGGLFSTQLGDITTLDPADFTDPDLYFEVELPTPATATCATAACAVYTEGPMTPRNKLGSSAYAFNADTVDGIDGANLGQLNGNNVWTGTNQIALTSTTAFQIQKAAGSDTIMTADTANNRLVVGNATASANADVTLFVVDNSTSTYTPTGVAGGMYYDTANNKFKCYTTSWVDCDTTGGGGGATRKVVLIPEFAGGTLQADGSNNAGIMNADFVNGLAAGQGYKHNYYQWTTSNTAAQDYNIIVNTQIPSEYVSGLTNLKIWGYASSTTLATATIQLTDQDGTVCYASPVSFTPSTASTWEEKSVGTMSGCSFSANDIITATIVVAAEDDAVFRVGELSYEYIN